MVKPPKTMQPEQIDVSKAGRGSGKSFKKSSFHDYMARKISMQRSQFGNNVLPPPPEPEDEKEEEDQKPAAVPSPPPEPQFSENPKKKKRKRSKIAKAPPSSPRYEPLPFSAQPKKRLLKRPLPEANDADDNDNGDETTTATAATLPPQQQDKKRLKQQEQRGGRMISFGIGTKPPMIGPKRKMRGNSNMRRIMVRLRKRHGKVSKAMMKRLSQEEEKEEDDDEEEEEEGDGDNFGVDSIIASPQHERRELSGDFPDPRTENDPSTTQSQRMEELDDGPLTTRNVVGYRPKQNSDGIPASESDTLQEAGITSPLLLRQQRPDLFFYGVVIKTQGYTDPDEATLRRLIQKHGGDYETYETTRVTHLIAQSLSTAKQNMYSNMRRPRPVCKPSWIVDSARAGKLLPQGQYLLNNSNSSSQTTIFQARKSSAACEDRVTSPQKKDLPAITKNEEVAQASSPRKRSGNQRTADGQIRNVSTDPDFVQTYFATSRLSFIGSFRLRNKNSGESHSDSVAKEAKDRFIFYVDMDEFFCSVVLRHHPEHRGKPVAISHNTGSSSGKGSKRSTSECATINYAARKYGLRKGMFLGEARELCPHLIVLDYDFEGYEEVTTQVTDILEKFVADPEHPGKCIPISCDEFVMEVYLMKHPDDLYSHMSLLAGELRKDIFGVTRCTASVGIARNQFLSKLACGKNKPNGSFVVQDHRHLVQGLTLRDLPG
ncbi:MAG: hypothetical protein SGILL_009091, partial [Bacillariaceae sp.]